MIKSKIIMKEKIKLLFIYSLFLISILFVYSPTRSLIVSKLTTQDNTFNSLSIYNSIEYDVNYNKLLTKNHFIVAGHAYGHHKDTNLGICNKLYKCLKQSISDSTDFIVFTGDFVRTPNKNHFSFLKKQMDTLQIPFYLTLGNHDNSKEGIEIMNNYYGSTYYTFKKESNQFIFLNTEENSYEPSEDQIQFLCSVIDSTTAKNIFVFSHKLMWVNHSPIYNIKFDNHETNYFDNVFWKKIFPILSNTKKDIYCIAGDAGGVDNVVPVSYEKIGNVRLISSGMGHAENENILVISTNKDSVTIEPMLLRNGDFINISEFSIQNY